MAKLRKIGVSLPSDMVQDIRRIARSGEYPTMSEVLREALRHWQTTQRSHRREKQRARKHFKQIAA